MDNDTFYLHTLSTVSEEDEGADPSDGHSQVQLLQTSSSSLEDGVVRCRICHSSGSSQETGELLMSPCECRGSLGHVHQNCLDSWLKRRGLASCELCHFRFESQRKIKPVREWRLDDMRERLTGEEKGVLLLGIINFLLLFFEFPFLYFIVKMNHEYFRSPSKTDDPSNVLPFLLLMLLVFVLIFITTSLIFVFCGAKICRKILNLNTEVVLFIPAVSYRVGHHEELV